MKKIIALVALSVAFVSCNQNNTVAAKDFKTAYVDTSKLMEESTEAKDIEAKYKDKAAEMDGKLQGEAARLQSEQKNFEANMQKNGEVWAKQKYMELQQRDHPRDDGRRISLARSLGPWRLHLRLAQTLPRPCSRGRRRPGTDRRLLEADRLEVEPPYRLLRGLRNDDRLGLR